MKRVTLADFPGAPRTEREDPIDDEEDADEMERRRAYEARERAGFTTPPEPWELR